MVKVFVCPNHASPKGTCESWDENGAVKSPDDPLKTLLEASLPLDSTVYLEAGGKGFALTWKGRLSTLGDQNWRVSQDDYRECQFPDCCHSGDSAKHDGKLWA
jgi:hypothetical protein